MANLASMQGTPAYALLLRTQELVVTVASYCCANYSQLSWQLGLVIALRNQNVDFFGKHRNVHKGEPFAHKTLPVSGT